MVSEVSREPKELIALMDQHTGHGTDPLITKSSHQPVYLEPLEVKSPTFQPVSPQSDEAKRKSPGSKSPDSQGKPRSRGSRSSASSWKSGSRSRSPPRDKTPGIEKSLEKSRGKSPGRSQSIKSPANRSPRSGRLGSIAVSDPATRDSSPPSRRSLSPTTRRTSLRAYGQAGSPRARSPTGFRQQRSQKYVSKLSSPIEVGDAGDGPPLTHGDIVNAWGSETSLMTMAGSSIGTPIRSSSIDGETRKRSSFTSTVEELKQDLEKMKSMRRSSREGKELENRSIFNISKGSTMQWLDQFMVIFCIVCPVLTSIGVLLTSSNFSLDFLFKS